jgi:alpha-tubulin suppressor-like RCC1 family protein
MPTATLPMPKVVDVDAGAKHVIALAADRTVFTWGNGQLGQLGIGGLPVINFRSRLPEVPAYLPFPVQVTGLEGVIGIAAGTDFSLALLKDGTVKAWGDNQYGQLGDGTRENRSRPVTVGGITNAVAVAAGGLDYSAALLRDGTVMTWGLGNGAFGRPGITRRSANPTPMLVPGVTGATAIAAGSQHMLALTAAGKVLSWGDVNVYDPIGRSGQPIAPGIVPLNANARAVFAGSLSSQALLDDGTFMAWGFLPSLWFRVDRDGGSELSRFPIPMVVKGM